MSYIVIFYLYAYLPIQKKFQQYISKIRASIENINKSGDNNEKDSLSTIFNQNEDVTIDTILTHKEDSISIVSNQNENVTVDTMLTHEEDSETLLVAIATNNVMKRCS